MSSYLKSTLIVLSLICSQEVLMAQTVSIDSLVKSVDQLQEERLKNIMTDQRDSVFELFHHALAELTRHPKGCSYEFDSSLWHVQYGNAMQDSEGITLAYAFVNNLVIARSDDARVRIISSDNLEGGPSHTYTCYAQLTDSLGNCRTSVLDTAVSDVDVGYYHISQAAYQGTTYYVLFGYGTYGGGHQHRVVRVIKNRNGMLVECCECYPRRRPIVLYSSRGTDPELTFDPEALMLRFQGSVYSEEDDAYRLEETPTTVLLTKCVLTD
jgi:hypothetical protein